MRDLRLWRELLLVTLRDRSSSWSISSRHINSHWRTHICCDSYFNTFMAKQRISSGTIRNQKEEIRSKNSRCWRRAYTFSWYIGAKLREFKSTILEQLRERGSKCLFEVCIRKIIEYSRLAVKLRTWTRPLLHRKIHRKAVTANSRNRFLFLASESVKFRDNQPHKVIANLVPIKSLLQHQHHQVNQANLV